MGKNPAFLPSHVMTVGGLLDAQERVIWSCRKCKAWALADLLAIQSDKGPTYSLVDRTSTCRVEGCGGKVSFHYGAPSRPLQANRERQVAAQLAAARRDLEQVRLAYNKIALDAGAQTIPPKPWLLRGR